MSMAFAPHFMHHKHFFGRGLGGGGIRVRLWDTEVHNWTCRCCLNYIKEEAAHYGVMHALLDGSATTNIDRPAWRARHRIHHLVYEAQPAGIHLQL
jgi:hypothetical protein